ncbi:hypothetical protein GQ457_18G019920 [Hibiscus cannabinus]
MQAVVVLSPTYCCKPHQSPEPSCSRPIISQPCSFFGARFLLTKGRNPARCCSWRIQSPRRQAENVESVLDEVRPYLIADGGNVALHEIDADEETGLELNEENIEMVLEEIRPYLVVRCSGWIS